MKKITDVMNVDIYFFVMHYRVVASFLKGNIIYPIAIFPTKQAAKDYIFKEKSKEYVVTDVFGTII
jgi:hypothetical protein